MESWVENFQKKIIVIGAGISGLACASHLKDYGFKNILILEAKNHIGGRTHTLFLTSDKKECNFIQHGAQWIHGQDNNVIYELAHSKGLIDKCAYNFYDALANSNLLFYTEEECEKMNSLLAYLNNKFKEIPENIKDISVLDYLNKAFTSFIVEHDDPKMVEFLKYVYDWYCKFQCELNGCIDLSVLSTCLLKQYQKCDGLQTVELKSGYSSVLNFFYQKMPNNAICTNHIVEKIDWSDFKSELGDNDKNSTPVLKCTENTNFKVKVFCSNGKVYEADHVIITIPLGCLKKYVTSLFVPALSDSKIKAIHSIGFGTVNKIFLEFNDPFWEPSTVYSVIWNKSLDAICHEKKEGSKLWLKDVNRFAYTYGHSNMLCAWVVGKGAITMESLSIQEIASHCMELLEKVIGNPLPKPKRVLRSRWYSDPYTHGSYSFLSVDSDSESNLQIAEPEISSDFCIQHPVLQFAGEASHPFHFSTVHGAYETGVREAQRLFEHYRNCMSITISSERNKTQICRNIPFEKLFHQNLKILVVGAGIAGLTAASSLYKKGYNDVSILEAQENMGGRILSLPLGNSILEFGAQWIHGTKNPLYEFSLKNHLLCDPSDELSWEANGLFCTSNGETVEAALVEEVKSILENTRQNLCDGLFDNCSASVSAQTLFSESFNSYIANYHNDPLNCIRKGLFSWFLKFEIIDNSCDNLDEVAIQCYSEWCDISDEEYHMNLKRGFMSVINSLHSQLPTGSLHLKKPVRTINLQNKFIRSRYSESFWRTRSSDSYPVLVECENGENIAVDVVIMTASIGYIQENMNSLFKPSLPSNKIKAFKNIGFGTINKIYLIYKDRFWGAQDKGFQLVWTKMDKELSNVLKNHSWVNGITGFDIVRKHPNVLLGWIGGIEAKVIESIDIETVSSVCTTLLRKFLNSPDIPYPSKTIRTCWYSNKYIRGAYSYRSCNFYTSDSKLEDVWSPLYTNYEMEDGKSIQLPAVHFAGEAMHKSCFSSAHGAFQSGLKVADDIDISYSKMIDLINGYCDK